LIKKIAFHSHAIKGYITTLSAGMTGALLFYSLHFPLPWMLGSLFGAFIATHLPMLHIVKPTRIANPMRAVLGVAIGAVFTPTILREILIYLPSLLLLLPVLVIMIYLGMVYFQKVVGFDRRTAFFCSLPGGMLEMSFICEAYGADIRRVVLIQTTRLLLIVFTIPFAIQHLMHIDLSGRTRIAAPLDAFPVLQIPILVGAAWISWWFFQRIKLSGATIVGSMVGSAVVYALGWVTARVPDEVINMAQWVLGTGIGCAFVSITLREVVRTILMTLGYFFILILVTISIATAIHFFTDVPWIATLLAFVPGGQSEMNMIALTVGIAVPYIVLHQITRMFLVITIAPMLSVWLLGNR
jgi:membrane AbrB-like protein